MEFKNSTDLKNETLQALQFIPQRPDYDTWTRIVAAVGNSFDEATALEILLSRFRDETPNEHRKKLRSRMKAITLNTLFWHARQNGYKGSSKHWTPPPQKPKKEYPEIIKIDEAIFEAIDKLPEFVQDVVQQYIAEGLNEQEARNIALSDAYWLKERKYRLMINESIWDKNLNKQGQPHESKELLNADFKRKLIGLDRLIDFIGKGHPFVCGLFEGRRLKSNCVGAELLAVDIDNGLTIEEALQLPLTREALFLYTTASHQTEKHRFRIVFALTEMIGTAGFERIAEELISYYKGDSVCKDISRIFYGYRHTTVYKVGTGEVINYFYGKRQI